MDSYRQSYRSSWCSLYFRLPSEKFECALFAYGEYDFFLRFLHCLLWRNLAWVYLLFLFLFSIFFFWNFVCIWILFSIFQRSVIDNQIGSDGALHFLRSLSLNSTLLNLRTSCMSLVNSDILLFGVWLGFTLEFLTPISKIGNNICDQEIESSIEKEFDSRAPLDVNRSFDVCVQFLQSAIFVPSWTSVRGDYLSPIHTQLPPEMWSEILLFLSNDDTSMTESFLVVDLRSGFYIPFPISRLSTNANALWSIVPLIEGHFRYDAWTMERLSLLKLSYAFFQDTLFLGFSSSDQNSNNRDHCECQARRIATDYEDWEARIVETEEKDR